MRFLFRLARNKPAPPIKRSKRPAVEGLEDRLLLYAATGGLWSYGSRVTYSFVPDGTNVGGSSSALFSTMNAKFATSTWQQQFQKAAAVWQQVAGINLVQVSDNGADIGTSGNQQGDSRFGDIRIGATSQSSSQLGFAFAPPPFNGGTNAGDIFLNSNASWQINSDYDLETVAIHEFGHALGLGHSAISAADMYASYNAIKQSLNSDDTSGIQSIYGTRTADAFDAASSNNSSSTATNITSYLDSNAQIAIPNLDITTSSDVDWYKVTVPSGTGGTMTVTMQSSGLSSLSPRVQVYNSSLSSLGYQAKSNTFGDTATVTVTGVTAGQVFYIKASNASGVGANAGAYGLLVNLGGSSQSPIGPPNTTVASAADQGGGTMTDTTSSGRRPRDCGGDSGDRPEWITTGDLGGWGDDLVIGNLYGGRDDSAVASVPASSDVPFLIGISVDQLADTFGRSDLEKISKGRK